MTDPSRSDLSVDRVIAAFDVMGRYLQGETPGLRVFLARPEYICAMKLRALQRESIGGSRP